MTVTEVSPFQEMDIIDLLIQGIGMRKIANGQRLPLDAIKAVADKSGHPDIPSMRLAKADLKRTPKMPDGPPARNLPAPRPGRTNPSPRRKPTTMPFNVEDDPTIAVIQRLTAAVRDQDKATITALIAGFGLHARGTLLVAMAAIISPATDLAAALEWIDLPPGEWSPETISNEVTRWEAGARDHTARTANQLTRQA